MTEYDRSQYLQATSAAAQDQIDAFLGGVAQLEEGKPRFLRFMPAYVIRDGLPVWASIANRHYGVPLPGIEGGKKVTFDCPQSIGGRCLVCENKKFFVQMGAWGDENSKGCKPSRRVRFNVIDCERPDNGVVILEDGTTLFKLLKKRLEDSGDLLFDPFEGSVLIVEKLDGSQDGIWRDVRFPQQAQCRLDQIHPEAMQWALPANLPDLDEHWNFPTVEQQLEWFAGIRQYTQDTLPEAPQQQQLPPPPQQAPPGQVIEGQVVQEQAPPAQAPAQAPAGENMRQFGGAATDAPAEAPAQAEGMRSFGAAEQQGAPTPAAPVEGTGSSSLLESFQSKLSEEQEDSA